MTFQSRFFDFLSTHSVPLFSAFADPKLIVRFMKPGNEYHPYRTSAILLEENDSQLKHSMPTVICVTSFIQMVFISSYFLSPVEDGLSQRQSLAVMLIPSVDLSAAGSSAGPVNAN